jgi:hypothetical protein
MPDDFQPITDDDLDRITRTLDQVGTGRLTLFGDADGMHWRVDTQGGHVTSLDCRRMVHLIHALAKRNRS